MAHAVGGDDWMLVDQGPGEDEILQFGSENADSIESNDSEENAKFTANLFQEGLQLASSNDPNV